MLANRDGDIHSMPNKTLRLESPADAFVDQVLAAAGNVQQGAKIMVLRSPLLDRLLARITSYEQQIAISERAFLDGRVDDEITGLGQKRDSLQTAVTAQQAVLAQAQQQVKVGQVTAADVAVAQKDLASAQSALTDATVAANQAPAKKQDALDKMTVAKNSLADHKTYIQSMQAALTITSPAQGTLNIEVGPGSYVRRGHLLGEVDA